MRAGEIPEAGIGLLGLLRGSLCPEYVPDSGAVALTVPWSEEQDYQVGIFLYDIQDFSAMIPSFPEASGERRNNPPMALELSYMIYCNESSQFGGVKRERIQTLLNEVIRTVHDSPVLEREGAEPLQLGFARLDIECKLRLWGSFQRPLQPAVYLRAAPVLVESGLWEEIHPVKRRDYRTETKEPRSAEERRTS